MTEEPLRKRLKTAIEPHPATIFESLHLHADEIRLVEIAPGSRKDDLNLEMRAWPLSQSPPFTALSYTWGGAQMTLPVCVNGTDFLLMPNVKSFFDEILSRAGRSYAHSPRHEWMTTRFWIDSICINQSDDGEKRSQVVLMKQIFERAEKVLTWLGPVDEGGDHGTDGEDAALEEGGGEEWEEDFLEQVSEDDEAFNKRFLAMTSLPYWTRAWVIQEATTPHRRRNAIVWRGKMSLQLDTVVGEALLVSSEPPSSGNTPLLHSCIDTFRLLAAIKLRRKFGNAFRTPGVIGIYTIFSCMRSVSSTDPRDRIYALLPLTNMAHIKDLAPDYRVSVESLYQKVAICMMQEEKSLNILGFGGQAENLKLPSWVPDWTLASPARAFPRCSLDPTSGRYENVYRTSSVEFDGFVDEEHGQLRVRGIKVDTIHACSATRVPAGTLERIDNDMDSDDDDDDDVDDDIWVELCWKTFALQRTSAYITGCSWREALAHTLCADLEDDVDFEKIHRGGTCPVPERGKLTSVLLEGRELVRDVTMWRRLFDTTGGYLGLGPRDAQQGDSVCVLNGCQFPLVLRQHGKFWKIVGEAYVHGLMDGEGDALGLESETFTIV